MTVYKMTILTHLCSNVVRLASSKIANFCALHLSGVLVLEYQPFDQGLWAQLEPLLVFVGEIAKDSINSTPNNEARVFGNSFRG